MNNEAFCIETIGGAVELVTFSRSNAVASLTPTTTLLYSRLMWLSPSSSRGNNLKTRRQRRKHWKSIFTRSSRAVTDARDARAKLTTTLQVHHAFLYTSLPLLLDTTRKYLFSGTTKFSFSFSSWIFFWGIQLQESSSTFHKVSELK